jgi:catechol 2,3-dioxygenase-like lactoylglutathione lyase family enzyme
LNKRVRLVFSFALALLIIGATVAIARPGSPSDDGAIDSAKSVHGHKHAQHGGDVGHLAPTSENVDLVSSLKLKNVVAEKIADVGVFKGYAYLAAWGVVTCKYNGVHVANIKNPAAPKEIAFIPSKEGSYPGEGVQALHIDTAAYNGDILVTNNEKCNDKAGFGGMNIYDINKPSAPTPLAVGAGDFSVNGQGKKDANEIHSVFAWDAGSKAYAVMVDNEEAPDVDIMDISNPKTPKLIKEYDLLALFPQIAQEGMPEVFHHDMIVKKIDGRWIMTVSYWDAGYIQLDVTDPKNATLVSDSSYAAIDPEAAESGLTVGPEGNGHQNEFTKNSDYVIATDEDFGPYKIIGRNLTDDTAVTASQGSDTPKLEESEVVTGPSVFFGRGCPGDPLPAAGGTGTQIAVVERGVCTFTEKVASVQSVGGYEAILVFNRTASDGCEGGLGMTVAGDIPTFGVAPRSQGFAIFDQAYDEAACLAGDGTQQMQVPLGTVGDALTFSSTFDGWGYVHLFDASDMSELDTYAIPEAHDPAFAEGFGDLSVHEVATSLVENDLAYYAYYSGGFRVTRIVDDELVEVGRYIDPNGNNFWGIQAFMSGGQEYAAASDRDHGLFIFRYTGD